MANRKSKSKKSAAPLATGQEAAARASTNLVPAPKLRAKLGISPVTLWRWRHDKEAGFPPAKQINGRLYFSEAAVTEWLERQPQAA
jgi:predicted DNA-binding transcriptional regulator AlpA